MITEILTSYELVLQDVRRMIAGLSEEQMVALPIEGMNHPAWIVGHLVFSCQAMGGELGVTPWLPGEWSRMFATGTVAEGAVSDQRSAVSERGRGERAETRLDAARHWSNAESRKEEDASLTQRRGDAEGGVGTGYPSKAALMAALADGQRRLVAVLAGMTDEELNSPLPDEEYRKTLPTIGVALMHILIGHTSLHAGQLSAWRRAMGLGTAKTES